MVYDGPEGKDNVYFQAMREEVLHLLQDDFAVTFEDYDGGWTLQSAEEAFQSALEASQVDLVLVAGFLSSHVALQRSDFASFTKPVVVPVVMQQWVVEKEISHSHLVYVDTSKTLQSELDAFRDVVNFQHLAIVGDLSLFSLFEVQEFSELGFTVSLYPVASEAQAQTVLEQLEESSADAVFLLPTWRLSTEAFVSLVEGINHLQLPSFSVLGEHEVDVDNGVFMTTTPHSHVRRLARRIALDIQQILLDRGVEEIDIKLNVTQELIINDQTAEQIAFDMPWDLLSRARLVQPRAHKDVEYLNMKTIGEQALQANRSIEAARLSVRAGKQRVRSAQSALGPQVQALTEGIAIDADRARFAGGAQPQWSADAGVRASQVIYDEEVHSSYQVEKKLQKAREHDQWSLELDLALESVLAYIDLLRVRALEKVISDNLALSRANLKRAQDRVEAGEALKSEIYRWQSEISKNHRNLLAIQAANAVGETELNRLLNRPLDMPVVLHDMTMSSLEFATEVAVIERHVNTSRAFRLFTEHMKALAREQSPELQAIEREIEAQSRILTKTRRSYYIPSVTASGEVTNTFHKDGAGSAFPPGVAVDRWNSSLEVSVALPLYTSGGRRAEKRRADLELQQLEMEQSAILERIDQRVINEMHNTKASYLSIDYAVSAAEAAIKNLQIVSDSYARGVVSIVDLIDAQTNALVAEQGRYNAVYRFYGDLLTLQRAAGKLGYMRTEEETQERVKQIQSYYRGEVQNDEK